MRGEPVEGITGLAVHSYHIWHVDKVKALVANQNEAVTFLCGWFQEFFGILDLFDEVCILEVDLDTLNRRIDARPKEEWGGRRTERELIVRLHRTKEEIPKIGTVLDATVPIARVVDEILCRVEANT